MSTLTLPAPPSHLTGPVKAWPQPVTIETYQPQPPNKNPMFLENRVYQGSSGKVYPLPLIERIASVSRPREWQAIHIENDYLRIMILPELGGRIHVGLDKTNGYDFFYRQNVIKPALVGLAGPWISGGVEFNWPQHHRPATYLPVQTRIESHTDGSITVWCSDHDPFLHMKAAHGICLHPDRALLELKVRLYNRTPLTQTFLWWANAAARVHEHYQSFFPPDVHFVADHAKRATSSYPLCQGVYYGVDYAERARNRTPPDEMPAHFVPPGSYPPNDLRWYSNIPVPTSYMALASEADFFGGYDHRRQAGFVHVADHHIAPGKKQWTWGNHEFGYSWDRHLTDSDGPYIELMAGVFSDNQPDFSFLAPGETKTFSQYWYPFRDIGIPQAANVRSALHVEPAPGHSLQIGIQVTEPFPYARLTVSNAANGLSLVERSLGDLRPAHPAVLEITLPDYICPQSCCLTLRERNGRDVISYSPTPPAVANVSPPASATEPPAPAGVQTVEELYLIGLHLEQYRHATRDPVLYWQEALRRDPQDSRCLEALALWHLRRGEFSQAEQYLVTAIQRLTRYNPNPPNGSPFYHLGIVQRFLGKNKEAYDAFYKATWNEAIYSAAHLALAEIDSTRERWSEALDHLTRATSSNPDHLRARNLLVLVLRKLHRFDDADQHLAANLALDPTDPCAAFLQQGAVEQADNQLLLDLAFDFLRAGFLAEAAAICQTAAFDATDGTLPLLCYLLAFISDRQAQSEQTLDWLRRAQNASPDFCFPNRLEEMQILEWARADNPADARAAYYLGNFYYDRRRFHDAIEAWEFSLRNAPQLPTAWRNLGIAYLNVENDPDKSRHAFDNAFALDPTDARVLFERDQLWKRIAVPPRERLQELEQHLALVNQRDDLSLELISLHHLCGRHAEALALLQSRHFQPWEGGEGLVREQHMRTNLALGRRHLLAGNAASALSFFEAALDNPTNLGEATHLLASTSHIHFWLAQAHDGLSQPTQARASRLRAIASQNDFRDMSVKLLSETSFYQVLAFRRLGRDAEADALLAALRDYAGHLDQSEPRIDYFATSLPDILLFRDNLAQRQHVLARFIKAQTFLASNDVEAANHALNAILAVDPNHLPTSDLIDEIRCFDTLGALNTRTSPAR